MSIMVRVLNQVISWRNFKPRAASFDSTSFKQTLPKLMNLSSSFLENEHNWSTVLIPSRSMTINKRADVFERWKKGTSFLSNLAHSSPGLEKRTIVHSISFGSPVTKFVPYNGKAHIKLRSFVSALHSLQARLSMRQYLQSRQYMAVFSLFSIVIVARREAFKCSIPIFHL